MGSIAVFKAANILTAEFYALLPAWGVEEHLTDGMSHGLRVVRTNVKTVRATSFL